MKQHFLTFVLLLNLGDSLLSQCLYTPRTDNFWKWASKGDSAILVNDFKHSLKYYYKAFSFEEPDCYHLYSMAVCYASLQNVDSSLYFIERAVELGFEDIRNLYNMRVFEILYDTKRWKETIEGLRVKEKNTLLKAGYNVELFYRLQNLSILDQSIRNQDPNKFDKTKLDSLFRVFRSIDSVNTVELKLIIKEYGWPSQNLVGPRGEEYAFMIAQHADGDPKFQKLCAELFKEACMNGNCNRAFLAGLIDRSRLNNGQGQLYGTQGLNDKLAPIDNKKELNIRRKEIGLPPITE